MFSIMKFFPNKNDKHLMDFNEKTATIFLRGEKFIAVFENGISLNLPIFYLKFFKPVNFQEKENDIVFEFNKNEETNFLTEKKSKKEKKKIEEEEKENEFVFNENIRNNVTE